MPNGYIDRMMSFTPDLRVLASPAAVGIVVGVLVTALPTWFAMRRRASIHFAWDRTIAGSTNRWTRGLRGGAGRALDGDVDRRGAARAIAVCAAEPRPGRAHGRRRDGEAAAGAGRPAAVPTPMAITRTIMRETAGRARR